MCVLSAIFGLTLLAIGTCGKENCMYLHVHVHVQCTCVLNYYVHVLAHFRDTCSTILSKMYIVYVYWGMPGTENYCTYIHVHAQPQLQGLPNFCTEHHIHVIIE